MIAESGRGHRARKEPARLGVAVLAVFLSGILQDLSENQHDLAGFGVGDWGDGVNSGRERLGMI